MQASPPKERKPRVRTNTKKKLAELTAIAQQSQPPPQPVAEQSNADVTKDDQDMPTDDSDLDDLKDESSGKRHCCIQKRENTTLRARNEAVNG